MNSPAPAPKPIQRSIEEMVEALRMQLSLLGHYRQLVREHRQEYVGELANKLRLLACDFGSNKGLLTELMRQTGMAPMVKLDGPAGLLPKGGQLTLDEYMGKRAALLKTPSGAMEGFSNADIVRAIAEKMGGAHQDWTLNERHLTLFTTTIYLANQPALVMALLAVANTVDAVGGQFIGEYDARRAAAPAKT